MYYTLQQAISAPHIEVNLSNGFHHQEPTLSGITEEKVDMAHLNSISAFERPMAHG